MYYDLETVQAKLRRSWKDRILGFRRRTWISGFGALVLLVSSLTIFSSVLAYLRFNTESTTLKSIYEQYQTKATSLSNSFQIYSSSPNSAAAAAAAAVGESGSEYQRANATMISLVRNKELWKMVQSIRDVEDRFNGKYHYDWVFLNEEEFSEEFINVTSTLVSGKAKYGKIPRKHWSYPDNLDMNRYQEGKLDLVNKNIIYGGLDSYRHMCRFNSGFFYKHELLQEYKYYWRVEPEIKFYCDVHYDPFNFMIENNKTYGFTIALKEVKETIPTLWDNVKNFVAENPQYVADNNLAGFLSDDGLDSYNMCHFWSNFEIADLDFLRSEAYEKFFEYLDSTNGFFYERWGDAPIHSIAVALFLNKDKVHLFQDFGYYHTPYAVCPTDMSVWSQNRCSCDYSKDFTFSLYSCAPLYYDIQGLKKPKGWRTKVKYAAPLIQ